MRGQAFLLAFFIIGVAVLMAGAKVGLPYLDEEKCEVVCEEQGLITVRNRGFYSEPNICHCYLNKETGEVKAFEMNRHKED